MEIVDITKLIDKRNVDLWNEIVSRYEVTLHASSNSEYACYSQANTIIFYVPQHKYCPDSFTHELLHVYIRLKEVYIGSNVFLRISADDSLQKIFSDRLLEHIGNCLDHIKMLPIYLQMGFKREKFLLDFYENKCTDNELNNIRQSFKIGSFYFGQAIDIFIGKFFSVKADPNNNNDYGNCLVKLRDIDERLFKILSDFVISWENYDLDNNDVFTNYRSLVDNFIEGLQTWTAGKEFI